METGNESLRSSRSPSTSTERPPSPAETILPEYVCSPSRNLAIDHVIKYTNYMPEADVVIPSLSVADRPPIYALMARPTTPIVYKFQSHSPEVTFLLPPRSLVSRGTIANISVALNLSPFAPLSYITTIRRGDSLDGAFIGEFEMAMARSHTATVRLGNQWSQLHRVLTVVHASNRVWKWSMVGVQFQWDCRTTLVDGSPMCVCTDARGLQIASLVPPAMDSPPPLPDATLTVFPNGHDIFDHILLPGLIVVRKLTLLP